jgi:hypothetical protein
MELVSYFLFLQEQIKDIIINKSLKRKPSVKSGALSDSFNISKKRVD